jgi:hypothetical protein
LWYDCNNEWVADAPPSLRCSIMPIYQHGPMAPVCTYQIAQSPASTLSAGLNKKFGPRPVGLYIHFEPRFSVTTTK